MLVNITIKLFKNINCILAVSIYFFLNCDLKYKIIQKLKLHLHTKNKLYNITLLLHHYIT